MSIQVPPAGPQDTAAAAAVRPSSPANAVVQPKTPALEAVPAAKNDTTPSRPPAEVLAEMEAASRRYDELRSQQRELHFKRDESANRVVVEVRDLEGNVLRTIPPSKALEVIAGGSLD
jgi:flagellar protein FlaG